MLFRLDFVITIIVLNAVMSEPSPSNRVKRGVPAADWEIKRWPNATVYYHVDTRLESIKAEIQSAFQQVENNTCVRYIEIERHKKPDYVYIEFTETYCVEPVGRQGGEQKIELQFEECAFLGFYLHASMQVLGFHHEHTRLDRDEYVDLFMENVMEDRLWEFDQLNATQYWQNSTFDMDSIMLYGSEQFSKNGKPTILKKDGSEIESWRKKSTLSPGDFASINNYYNCPEDWEDQE